MIYRPRQAPDRLRRRLAGAEEFIVSAGRSFTINSMLRAADVSFPGAGILLNMVFGKLFNDTEKAAETRAHFSNQVIGPIVRAAQSKDFSNAAGLLVSQNAGTNSIAENVGYIYQNARGALPAAFAVVIGHALSTKDFAAAQRFAAAIDMLQSDAEWQFNPASGYVAPLAPGDPVRQDYDSGERFLDTRVRRDSDSNDPLPDQPVRQYNRDSD